MKNCFNFEIPNKNVFKFPPPSNIAKKIGFDSFFESKNVFLSDNRRIIIFMHIMHKKVTTKANYLKWWLIPDPFL